jgi:hypothetical protein
MTITIVGGGNPSGPTFPVQRSVRLRSSASANFIRTPATTTNRRTFTWSGWVKLGLLDGAHRTLFASQDNNTSSGNLLSIYLLNNVLNIVEYSSAYRILLTTTQLFRDPSAWYHIIVSIDTTQATASNRALIYVNNVQVTSFSAATYPSQNTDLFMNVAAQPIGIGVRPAVGSNVYYFDGYLTEINFIDGQALTPTSFGAYNSYGVWSPAKYSGSYGTNGFYLPFTNNTLSTLLSTSANISAPFGGVATNALVADGVYCTSNTSVGSSFTFILNDFGSATQVTRYTIVNLSFTGGASTFSVQGSPDNSTWTTFATLSVTASNQSFSGSLNGNFRYWRLAPTSFGTNGQAAVDQCVFFQDGLGLDFSGNGNNWTPNNISVTAGVTYDSMLDVPTNTSPTNANFPVLNAVSAYTGLPITNANLQTTAVASGANWFSRSTTMGFSSGKIYAEFSMPSITAGGQGNPVGFGIMPSSIDFSSAGFQVGNPGYGYGFYCPDTAGNTPKKIVNNVTTAVGTGTATTTSDIFMVAFDLTNGNGWFGKNGTWYAGNPSAGTGASITGITAGEYIFGLSVYRDGTFTNNTAAINFGQRPFSYTPPTGFVALNTYNLATPVIPNGAAQMAATTYTGTGAALSVANTVNGVSFQPDFVWLKGRSVAYNNYLYDSVRGALKELYSDSTSAEVTATQTMTSFNSGGFSVGTNAGVNQSAATFVGWQWKANGTPSVINTSGSIPSTISANTTAGFSIVTWTGNGVNGATIGHGLNTTPAMAIIKNRSAASTDWVVLNKGVYGGSNWSSTVLGLVGYTNILYLNSTSAAATLSNIAFVNGSGNSMLAYFWAEIPGFSKFGGYTGNGLADGPFIYCGFRPRFIMIKDYGNPASNWIIQDTSRSTFNMSTTTLAPNSIAAEATYSSSNGIDFLSNGFKVRVAGTPVNTSGNGILYAAFAENPFNYSLAR